MRVATTRQSFLGIRVKTAVGRRYLTPRGTTIQDVGVIPDVGLPGLDMPFVPTPLPSADEFDAAFEKRTCDKPPADFVASPKGVI